MPSGVGGGQEEHRLGLPCSKVPDRRRIDIWWPAVQGVPPGVQLHLRGALALEDQAAGAVVEHRRDRAVEDLRPVALDVGDVHAVGVVDEVAVELDGVDVSDVALAGSSGQLDLTDLAGRRLDGSDDAPRVPELIDRHHGALVEALPGIALDLDRSRDRGREERVAARALDPRRPRPVDEHRGARLEDGLEGPGRAAVARSVGHRGIVGEQEGSKPPERGRR